MADALRLRLRPAAQRDLVDIWRFGHDRWGPDQAEAYTLELEATLALPCASPGIGVLRRDLTPPLRTHTHRRHLIVYDVNDPTLDVVRILHGRADWKRQIA